MTLAIHEICHTMHSRIWIFGGLLCPNIRAIRQHHIWFMQQQHNRTYVWIMKGCDKDTFFFSFTFARLWKKIGPIHTEIYALIYLCQFAFFLFSYRLTRRKRFILCVFVSQCIKLIHSQNLAIKTSIYLQISFSPIKQWSSFLFLFSVYCFFHKITRSQKDFMKCALIWRQILFSIGIFQWSVFKPIKFLCVIKF